MKRIAADNSVSALYNKDNTPTEVLAYIFTLLEDIDRAAICSVSTYWCEIAIATSMALSSVLSSWQRHLHYGDLVNIQTHHDYHLFVRTKPLMCVYEACAWGNLNVLKHILGRLDSPHICTCGYYEKYINDDGLEVNVELSDSRDLVITFNVPSDKFTVKYYRCASIACTNGRVDVIKYLLTNHYAECLAPPKEPFAAIFKRSATTLFTMACSSGNIPTVEYILTHNPSKLTHGFYEACKYGYLDVVKLILARVGSGVSTTGTASVTTGTALVTTGTASVTTGTASVTTGTASVTTGTASVTTGTAPAITTQPYINMLKNCLVHVCGPVVSKTVDFDAGFTIKYDPSVITQQNRDKIEVFDYVRNNYNDNGEGLPAAIFNAAYNNDQMLQYMMHVVEATVLAGTIDPKWLNEMYELAICGACCSGNLNKVKALLESRNNIRGEYNKRNPRTPFAFSDGTQILESYLAYAFTRGNIKLIEYLELLFTGPISTRRYGICLGAACRHGCTTGMKIAIERGAAECFGCLRDIQDHLGDYSDDEFILERVNADMAHDTSMEE